MCRSIRHVLLLLLLSWLLFLPPVYSQASSYTITEDQLSTLEWSYKTLSSQLQERQQILTQQRAQLTMLKAQQTQSDQLISQLKTQQAASETALTDSKAKLTQTQTQLDLANKSLQTYGADLKATNKRLQRQRTMWQIVAVVAVGAAISRR
nr:MAG TPA: Peptidoglycan endopeptidase [Bacteriophage sp.]